MQTNGGKVEVTVRPVECCRTFSIFIVHALNGEPGEPHRALYGHEIKSLPGSCRSSAGSGLQRRLHARIG